MSALSPTLPRLILTRPSAQAGAWLAALTEAGFEVAQLPLIDIELLPAPKSATLLDLQRFDAIFFVSRNAIDGLLAWVGLDALQSSHARLLCPGPGSAQALRALGLAPDRITAPPEHATQDSEQLWQVAQSQLPLGDAFRLLVVKGEDSNSNSSSSAARPNWLAAQATAQGASVEQIIVYRRRAPDFTVAQAELAQAAAQDGSVWIFSSSQAIAHLTAALPDSTWQNARCLATHPRIASSAEALGFQTQLAQPSLNALVHQLRQLAL